MQDVSVTASRQTIPRTTRSSVERARPLRLKAAAVGPAVLRPGRLGRLLHAVSVPGGIPPGRARPVPPGTPRDPGPAS